MTTESTTTRPETCQHAHDVDLLTQRGLRASSASIFSAAILVDEQKAACQAECGAASPWHGVELHPVDRAAAVAALEPYDPHRRRDPDETFTDLLAATAGIVLGQRGRGCPVVVLVVQYDRGDAVVGSVLHR